MRQKTISHVSYQAALAIFGVIAAIVLVAGLVPVA